MESRKRKREITKLRVCRHRAIAAGQVIQKTEIENRMKNEEELSSASNTDRNESKDVISAEDRIRLWAIKHNITRNALCELLKILISFGLTWLPADARTLLRTPKTVEIKSRANGKVWYSGIKRNLHQLLRNVNQSISLELNINVDGVPLFKGSRHEFWPILCNVHSKC